MYSRGIEVLRSSNEATPSVKPKVERRMRLTCRATIRPISLFWSSPAPTRASPMRSLRSPLQERLGLAVFLGGDAALRDQRLPQAVLLQVAGGEDRAAVVEEDGLDRAARLHLQVPAAALDGKLPQGLGDRGDGQVGEHQRSRGGPFFKYHGGRRRHNPPARSGCAVPHRELGDAPAPAPVPGRGPGGSRPRARGVAAGAPGWPGGRWPSGRVRPWTQGGTRPGPAGANLQLQLPGGETRLPVEPELDPGEIGLAPQLDGDEVPGLLDLVGVPPACRGGRRSAAGSDAAPEEAVSTAPDRAIGARRGRAPSGTD